jgi:phosphatidylserine decarboxylase
MRIAREGFREIAWGTLMLGACAALSVRWWPPAGVPFVLVWGWVLWFFRDPRRKRSFQAGELCAPADGVVTEVSELPDHDVIGGPATRIGIFLGLFDVHVNRMPCSGRVRSVLYRPGTFLDARDPASGERNESNTLVIDPVLPMPGPVVVRQVAGLVARRIICHAEANQDWAIGARFGLIKFGSRAELIIPRLAGMRVEAAVGDKVRAGWTVLARQWVAGEVDGVDPPAQTTSPANVRAR